MSKVLITGSRNWRNYQVIKDAIANSGCDVVIEGEASGADSLAREVANELGLQVRKYPAKWALYGRAAGPKRNQEMLDKEHTKDDPIKVCLAFPMRGSKGTYDMIRRAEKAGIKVIICEDEL